MLTILQLIRETVVMYCRLVVSTFIPCI